MKTTVLMYMRGGGKPLEVDMVLHDAEGRMSRLVSDEPNAKGQFQVTSGYKATVQREDGSTYETSEKKTWVNILEHTLTLCDRCGKAVKNDSNFTTGYGVDREGDEEKVYCFACCGLRDAERMEVEDKTYLYYCDHPDPIPGTFQEQMAVNTPRFYSLTNWPGTFKIPLRAYHITVKTEYPWGRATRVTRVSFEYKGRKWVGAMYGDNTQVMNCKRLKEKSS